LWIRTRHHIHLISSSEKWNFHSETKNFFKTAGLPRIDLTGLAKMAVWRNRASPGIPCAGR
jgi:hypothetical protein